VSAEEDKGGSGLPPLDFHKEYHKCLYTHSFYESILVFDNNRSLFFITLVDVKKHRPNKAKRGDLSTKFFSR